MKSLLALVSALLLLPGLASARCSGTDLIAAMAEPERADLMRAADAVPYP